MKLMLCAATQIEIAPTIEFIKKHSLNVDVVITGVGVMAATYALSKVVFLHQPHFVVQAGIAGGLKKDIPLTTVVVVQNETIGDSGVFEKEEFHSVFKMGLTDADEWPWKKEKLQNDFNEIKNMGLPLVDAVTVNEISTDEHRINYYRDRLNASIETMEGAALHYVCLKENISFLQVRSLSNYIGERDKSKWMLQAAVSRLNEELQGLLTKILKS